MQKKKRERETFALYIFPLFPLPFACFSLGLNRENNAHLSEEKVRSIRNDSLILEPTP